MYECIYDLHVALNMKLDIFISVNACLVQ